MTSGRFQWDQVYWDIGVGPAKNKAIVGSCWSREDSNIFCFGNCMDSPLNCQPTSGTQGSSLLGHSRKLIWNEASQLKNNPQDQNQRFVAAFPASIFGTERAFSTVCSFVEAVFVNVGSMGSWTYSSTNLARARVYCNFHNFIGHRWNLLDQMQSDEH